MKRIKARTLTLFLLMVFFGFATSADVAGDSCCSVSNAPSVNADLTASQSKSSSQPGTRTKARYAKSKEVYQLEEITLIDQDGQKTTLKSLLDWPRPVAVNFIFTTCSTICPVLTATMSEMYQALGDDAGGLRVVSISLDPQYDTPEVLKSYAKRYQAGDNWRFLTGDLGNVSDVLKSLDAYVANKMNHRPLTLFKLPGSDQWLRIDGFASAEELATEYRRMVESG